MSMKIEKGHLKHRVIDCLSLFLLMSCMIFSITYLLTFAMKLKYAPVKLMAVVLISLGFWSVVLLNKISRRVTLGILLSISLIGSFYLYKKHLIEETFLIVKDQVTAFINWSFNCIAGNFMSDDYYTVYFVIALTVGIALIVYCFTIKKFNFWIIFIGGTFLFVFETIQKNAVHSAALYIFVFASIIYFFRNRFFSLKKELDEHNFEIYSAYMKISFCIGIVIFIGSFFLAFKYPYQAKLFHDIAEKFSKKEYVYVTDQFSVKSAGLQTDDGMLGGNLAPNKTPVLQVKTPSPIYLKAQSYAVYTGKQWKNEPQEPEIIDLNDKQLQDTTEALECSKWLTNTNTAIQDLFYENNVEIKFLSMSTKSLFIPPKMKSFEIVSRKREVFLTYRDQLTLEKPANKYFTYREKFYQPKLDNDKFKEILRKSKIGFYNELTPKFPWDNEMYKKWGEHASELTLEYTQLPDGLPARIKQLAKDITKNESNNYDKVKAIEEYLANHYYYTLKPGIPRVDKDFVDQFLFEGKKGYCTYFASAMTVLTRSVGIPSRYVEGYALPQTQDYSVPYYIVTNERAHAWTEVYFEGIGWIQFEATPPYRQVESPSKSGMSMEEAMRNAQKSFTGSSNNPALKKSEQTDNTPWIILCGVVVIGGIFAAIWLKKRSFRKLPKRMMVLYMYSIYLKLLKRQKLVIEGGETEKVFAQRIDQLMHFTEVTFSEITDLYLVARYSQLELSEEDSKEMFDFRFKLLGASRKRLNLMEYITCRIVYKFL